MIISDRDLHAALVPVPGKPTHFKIVPKGSDEKTAKGRLIFGPDGNPACLIKRCFRVFHMSPTADLAKGVYHPAKAKPDQKPTPEHQALQNMFTPGPAGFDKVRGCWDINNMNHQTLKATQCRDYIFTEPDKSLANYREVNISGGSKIAIPYGWKYDGTSMSWGSNSSRIVETGQDVVRSSQINIGWKTGFNFFVINTSLTHSKETEKRSRKMYENGYTYAEYDIVSKQFALVVDKVNLNLSDGFKKAVRRLKNDHDYTAMRKQFGTHYAYATTFGQRGTLTSTMSSSEVLSLHEDNVNISSGASAGFKIPTEDGSVSGDIGLDSKTATSNSKEMKKHLKDGFGKFYCLGGLGCEHGVPSGSGVTPILLDLRPISDLLGPPFFKNDPDMITLREGLRTHIAEYAFGPGPGQGRPSALFYKFTDITLANSYWTLDSNNSNSGVPTFMDTFTVSLGENRKPTEVQLLYNIIDFQTGGVKSNKVVLLDAPPISPLPELIVSGAFRPPGAPNPSMNCLHFNGIASGGPLSITTPGPPVYYDVVLKSQEGCPFYSATKGDGFLSFNVSFKVQPISASSLLLEMTD